MLVVVSLSELIVVVVVAAAAAVVVVVVVVVVSSRARRGALFVRFERSSSCGPTRASGARACMCVCVYV